MKQYVDALIEIIQHSRLALRQADLDTGRLREQLTKLLTLVEEHNIILRTSQDEDAFPAFFKAIMEGKDLVPQSELQTTFLVIARIFAAMTNAPSEKNTEIPLLLIHQGLMFANLVGEFRLGHNSYAKDIDWDQKSYRVLFQAVTGKSIDRETWSTFVWKIADVLGYFNVNDLKPVLENITNSPSKKNSPARSNRSAPQEAAPQKAAESTSAPLLTQGNVLNENKAEIQKSAENPEKIGLVKKRVVPQAESFEPDDPPANPNNKKIKPN